MLRTLILVSIILALAGCDIIKGSQVEGDVLKALSLDPRTQSYSFEVSYADGGDVTITGRVWSDAELSAVTEIARGVEGVKSVINNCSLEEQGSGMLQDETAVTPYL